MNYPTQYAKALVVNFNRWPTTPGHGAGTFLYVNGMGATTGCVSGASHDDVPHHGLD
ncbi:hypothetical protein AB0I52_14535 [Streptomyces sp. NPDC050423]|uniref:hypothetical protein n=1 Tax=Streptomyces sp. NPDC050423 TaxID=3155402 RepID=UPI0034298135